MHLKPLLLMAAVTAGITNISGIDTSKFNQAIKSGRIQLTPSKTNLADLHEASTLVVSCVDFRLRDEIAELCNVHLGLLDDYDEGLPYPVHHLGWTLHNTRTGSVLFMM